MIVVTGANGFIGSALVWQLNQAGITDILCVDTVDLTSRPLPLKKRSYKKFVGKDQLWDELNSGGHKIDWILHMGANSSTTETNWEHLYENNTLYTQRLFEWCARNGAKFVYASSAATYGAGELGYDDHTDSEQLKPLNLYGKSKVIFDRWAVMQPQTPSVWFGLKFFNVYGPNEYHKEGMTSVVFKAFHQIRDAGFLQLFKSYIPQFKDGEQMRDFVYVKEVTAWIMELMNKPAANGIYNMGYGQARTWVDLGRAVFKGMNKSENIKFVDMPGNLRDQYQYFTEARMQKWIGQGLSEPKWSLEKGVQDYVQNYLLNVDPYL